METKVMCVRPNDLKLLELNARYMEAPEFNKLVENVKRDGCLTQLPFCAYDDDWQLEVLSGNHRVQAAIAAGLETIDVQMTDEPLTRDQKIAIQLSHNAISGKDDMAILKELYAEIDSIDAKEYCGLDDETLEMLEKIGTQSMCASGLEYRIVNLLFLPSEVDQIQETLKAAKSAISDNVTLMASMKDYDKYLDTMVDVSKGSRIKNTAVAFMAMLQIVNDHIEDLKSCWIDEAPDKEYVPLSTIIGRSDIRADDGRVLNKAIDRLVSKGIIKKREKEKGLSVLAEYYMEAERNGKKKGKQS